MGYEREMVKGEIRDLIVEFPELLKHAGSLEKVYCPS